MVNPQRRKQLPAMRNRPPLVKGDVCKYHKRLTRFPGKSSFRNVVLIVLNPGSDSRDGRAQILVNAHIKSNLDGKWIVIKTYVQRRDIWKTGANVLENELVSAIQDMRLSIEGHIVRAWPTPSVKDTGAMPAERTVDASSKKALLDWLEK